MRALLACGIIMSGLLSGCDTLGPKRPQLIRYYSIDSLPLAVQKPPVPWAVSLSVRPVTAATRYRSRILYRISEVEVGFYEYDRWVELPEEMVTRAVVHTLEASGRFRQVLSEGIAQPPAWILSGELVRFDEVRQEGGRWAECSLQLEVRRARDEAPLWSGLVTVTEPLPVETRGGLAQAMSRAVQQAAMHFIARLEEAGLRP